MEWQLKTIIRGRSASVISPQAKYTYCQLVNGQPLILEHEPTNHVDPNAVLVKDLMGAPCGYVAREHAPEVSAKIKSGLILMAKAIGPCICIARRILIWHDGDRSVEIEESIKRKPKVARKKQRELEPTAFPSGKDEYGSNE